MAIVIRDQKEVAGADESLETGASKKDHKGLVNDSTEAAIAETEKQQTLLLLTTDSKGGAR